MLVDRISRTFHTYYETASNKNRMNNFLKFKEFSAGNVPRSRRVMIGLFFIFWLVGVTQHVFAQEYIPEDVKAVLQKDEITILVTDSGLGGLSVVGGIEVQAETSKAYKNIHLIFCNALPEANFGYNNIESEEKKATVFSDALLGMVDAYHPDVVFIACNTLSVVYPETKFAKTSAVPVLGIVELGAELLYQKLKDDSSTSGIIFGTETTISASSHKNILVSKGISEDRIIPEACPELAGEIQNNPKSDMVLNMVEMYVSDAVSRISSTRQGKVYAGFCCTHYGYSSSTFLQSFKNSGITAVELVNPNDAMANVVFRNTEKKKYSSTTVTVTVVSRAPLSQAETGSIGLLLEQDSPKTANALKHYVYKEDLFRFEKE